MMFIFPFRHLQRCIVGTFRREEMHVRTLILVQLNTVSVSLKFY